MVVEAVYYTGRGRIRMENEDSLIVGNLILNREEMDGIKTETTEGEGATFAVADGMGGYLGGAVASGVIVSELGRGKGRSVSRSLERAKQRIKEIGLEDRLLSHMGSVVSGIVVSRDGVDIFNIGDSRTYLYRGSLKQMTEDDSYVWEAFAEKGLSPEKLHEEIRYHPKKNIVTSALTGGRGRYNLKEKKIGAEEGDRYLICSDGLWEEMGYEFIEESMRMEIGDGAKRLLKKANMEARDNISFIIVEIKSK